MLCQQNLISQHKYMVMTQQKYAISAKIWQVSEMSWFSKKLRCVCKTCILPNWHAHIRVRISVVLWRHVSCYYFSNQNYLVSAKLPESAKSPGDDSWYMLCQQQCVVISIDDVLWPDPDLLFIVCGLWPASGFCQQQRRALRLLCLHHRLNAVVNFWVQFR